MKKTKLLALVVIVYCIFQATLSYFFYLRYAQGIQEEFEQSHKHFATTYQSLVTIFREIPTITFHGMMNHKAITSLVSQANDATDEEKDLIRKELFHALNPLYEETLKPKNFHQLQIILLNGERLIQFLNPLIYGDKLATHMPIIEKVMQTKQMIEDIMVLDSGLCYCYFFPLIENDQLVAILQLSVPANYFSNKASELMQSQEAFLVKTKVLEHVFEKNNLDSFLPSFLGEQYRYNTSPSKPFVTQTRTLSTEQIRKINTSLTKTTPSADYLAMDQEFFIHTLPLKNFQNETLGYIASLQKNRATTFYYKEMVLDIISLSCLLLLAFILFFMYKKQQQLYGTIRAHNTGLEQTVKKRTQELTRYNSFLNSIFNAIPSPLFLKDKEGRYLKCNKAFAISHGIQNPKDIVGKTIHDLLKEPHASDNMRADQALIKKGSAIDYEVILERDGETKYFIVHKNLLKENNEITGVVGVIQDITHRRLIHEQLENALEANRIQQEALAKDSYIINHYAIYIKTDANGLITDVSKAMSNISGFKQSELIGQRYANIFDNTEPVIASMKQALSQNKEWKGTVECKRKDGNTYWLKTNIIPQFDDTGLKTGYIAFGTDISTEMHVKGMIYMDELTKVHNRKKLNESLVEALNVVKRYPEETTAFILLDIDDFKKVNDTHGHLVGDSVLKELSALVNNSLRDVDIFARWGGEEFAILAPKTSLKGAIKITEKVRTLISSHRFTGVKRITCSFGVTEIKHDDTIDDLVQRADKALYTSKNRGKNRIEILG